MPITCTYYIINQRVLHGFIAATGLPAVFVTHYKMFHLLFDQAFHPNITICFFHTWSITQWLRSPWWTGLIPHNLFCFNVFQCIWIGHNDTPITGKNTIKIKSFLQGNLLVTQFPASWITYRYHFNVLFCEQLCTSWKAALIEESKQTTSNISPNFQVALLLQYFRHHIRKSCYYIQIHV